MLKGNKVNIKQEGHYTKVFIDGVEITQVCYLSVEAGVDTITTLTLEVIPGELDIDGDILVKAINPIEEYSDERLIEEVSKRFAAKIAPTIKCIKGRGR